MKKFFIFILKTQSGVIYPSCVMSPVSELHHTFANFAELGVSVIDVKVFYFNPADYE